MIFSRITKRDNKKLTSKNEVSFLFSQLIFVVKKIVNKDEDIMFESVNDFDEITVEGDISSTSED